MNKQGSPENLHEQAQRLIDKDRIEGLAQDETRWLADHLSKCESCAHRSSATNAAVSALKAVAVQVPRGLAASTTLRVREEAAKLKQRRARNLALTAGCAVSWIAGVASAPLVWRLCEWFGTTFDLPTIVWEVGFLSWWLVPAASAALVILWVNSNAERESFNELLRTRARSGELEWQGQERTKGF